MRLVHIPRQQENAWHAYRSRQKRTYGSHRGLDSPAYPRDQICMVRTIYCVQPYVRSAGRLAKGHLRRLLSRDAAIRAARAEKGCASGVVVYRVTGSWEADSWSDPVLIARAGDVPAEAA